MGNKYTNGEIVETLRLIEKHGRVEAAKLLGVAPRTLADRVNEAKIRGLTADTPVRDPLEKARQEIAQLKRELNLIHKHNETAEETRRVLYELADFNPDPPVWVSTPDKKSAPAVPMTIWSDWHASEVVTPEETAGMNEFSSKILDERVQRLVERTIFLSRGFAFRQDSAPPPGIVVCLGGDMISGDIHEELADTNDMYPMEAVHHLVDLISAALLRLADEFGRVFVPCVVGNHGRTSRKPRMKGRIHTSYEWNLYCQLERFLKADKRITFMVPGETDAHFSVQGHRFLLTHGDSLGVKGGDGIIGAIGPIMRGAMKVGRSESQIGRDFDTIVMGHWHQELFLPGVIVNNALKGYDEYARLQLRAPFSRPSQNLWFVHHEQGITARIGVYCDKAPPSKKKPGWVELPQAM